MVATAEALALGEKLGMDPKLLTSIINSSSGKSWSSEIYNPVPGVCVVHLHDATLNGSILLNQRFSQMSLPLKIMLADLLYI